MFPPKKKPMMDPGAASSAELDDIMKFARGHMSRDMAQRHGKPLPPDDEDLLDGGSDEATEDPDIPGVEASDQPMDGADSDPGNADVSDEDDKGVDPELLRKVLASLKSGR